EHRQQIAPPLDPRRPPLPDEPRDQLVEPSAGPPEAARAREGQGPDHARAREQEPVEHGERVRERLPDLARLPLYVGLEERAADNGERQPRHLGVDVDHRAVPPAVARAAGGVDHLRAVRGDALGDEERLEQPPLAPVRWSPRGLILRDTSSYGERMNLRNRRYAYERLVVLGGLAVASVICLTLELFRERHYGAYDFRFLVWNLVLAWVPPLLALVV